MAHGQDPIRLHAPSLHVELGGVPMPKQLEEAVLGLDIERATLLIDTATMTFRDASFRLQNDPLLSPGTSLRILGDEGRTRALLFEGSITGGEVRIHSEKPPTWTVRAFHPLHRLTATRHTRLLPAGTLVTQLSELVREPGWTASAPDRRLPSLLQNDQSDWAMVRRLALRTGLRVSFGDGVLALSERNASTIIDLGGGEDVEEIRVIRSCESSPEIVVSAWDPIQARLQSSVSSRFAETRGTATRHARPARVADVEDSEALSSSLRARDREGTDRLEVKVPRLISASPDDTLRVRGMAPVFDGKWRLTSVRQELGPRGAWTRLSGTVSQPGH